MGSWHAVVTPAPDCWHSLVDVAVQQGVSEGWSAFGEGADAMRNAWVYLVAAAIGVWAVGFGIGTVQPTPAKAKMFVDIRNQTFLTPPCRENHTFEFAAFGPDGLVPTTVAAVRARQQAGEKLTPDKVCEKAVGGFHQRRALLPRLLGLGKDRWTADGDWNW